MILLTNFSLAFNGWKPTQQAFGSMIKDGYVIQGPVLPIVKYSIIRTSKEHCELLCDVLEIDSCEWEKPSCHIPVEKNDHRRLTSYRSCAQLCQNTKNCNMWSFVQINNHENTGECSLYDGYDDVVQCRSKHCISGFKFNQEIPKFKIRAVSAPKRHCYRFNRIIPCSRFYRQ